MNYLKNFLVLLCFFVFSCTSEDVTKENLNQETELRCFGPFILNVGGSTYVLDCGGNITLLVQEGGSSGGDNNSGPGPWHNSSAHEDNLKLWNKFNYHNSLGGTGFTNGNISYTSDCTKSFGNGGYEPQTNFDTNLEKIYEKINFYKELFSNNYEITTKIEEFCSTLREEEIDACIYSSIACYMNSTFLSDNDPQNCPIELSMDELLELYFFFQNTPSVIKGCNNEVYKKSDLYATMCSEKLFSISAIFKYMGC